MSHKTVIDTPFDDGVAPVQHGDGDNVADVDGELGYPQRTKSPNTAPGGDAGAAGRRSVATHGGQVPSPFAPTQIAPTKSTTKTPSHVKS